MLLSDLIRPGQECMLRHPDIGEVLWTRRIWKATAGAWGLVWMRGDSRGRSLIADESVLFDKRWEAIAGFPADREIQELDNFKVPPAADKAGDPAAVASLNELWIFIDRLPGNPLDDPRFWAESAGDFLRTVGHALGGMPSESASYKSGIDPTTPSWALFAWVLRNARDLVRM